MQLPAAVGIPAQVRQRRAAAARRRGLLATLLAVGLVAFGILGIAAGVWLPAILAGASLGTVCVAGRRTVVAQNRTDVARGWIAAPSPRTARVTPGVKPAADSAPVGAQEAATTPAAQLQPGSLAPLFTMGNDTGEIAVVSGAIPVVPDAAPTPAQDTASSSEVLSAGGSAASATASQIPAQAGQTWEPSILPRPTYTFKAAAPRREVAPLPAFDPALLAAGPGRSASGWEGNAVASGEVAGNGLEVTAGTANPTEQGASTLTGELSLNELLARRRAN